MQQSGICSFPDAGSLILLIVAGCLPLGAGRAKDLRFLRAFVLKKKAGRSAKESE